jgi:peptidoglycan hydrolase-like protein with peptidoglycan-binding domain
MLGETAPHYNRIAAVPLTGEYDADTQSAVRHAQKIFQLPETGITDRATWQALTGLHNALFQRTPLGWQINGELRLENEK